MIGVAITEHNRYSVFRKSYEEIKRFLPDGALLVVVDDASSKPVPEATFRFEKNVGIARAKNKCIELLYKAGCQHFFLFDSDTYPKCADWWKPYVESKEPHLNYIFKDFSKGNRLNDTQVVYQDSKHIAYSHVRGCMMYYTRDCFDKVGGMLPDFGKWGYEHPDLSNRIFMAGLTSFRYMDVVGSSELIHSGDEHREVLTTVAGGARQLCIKQNKTVYESRLFSKEYVHFIENKNILLTTYFTGVSDPQRKEKWTAKLSDLEPLVKSLKQSRLVILHDCFDSLPKWHNVEFVRVQTSVNPYIQRWISYREYLMQNKESIDNVFCIDGTDVEVLREPDWASLGKSLFTGDENEVVGCPWIVKNHSVPVISDWIKNNSGLPLLNAGICGGSVETLIEFTRQIIDFWQLQGNMGLTDMALFNYIARTNWNPVTGRQICTLFKGFEVGNKVSWFKHK